MKKLTIKTSITAILAIAGLQMATSCNSCAHKDNPETQTTSATHDTVYIDTCMSPNDSLIREGASGMYVPVGRGNSTSATGNGGSVGGKAPAAGTTKAPKQLSQEEIDNRVENSGSSTAYKNGKPANSGGTSGSGQGTGTGSTGNNSRVTTKEDQLKN
ncbi:hypothetical protein AM493_18515 [Flavobacterium akiainvivens]|uniref:Lipoprotein n=1 Tax=Flavobacterium akiainvivens TaxID=1202724 RepID=A0A0M8MFH7_9FLAO|nr:hypothetical protein [Flavobacterium akiainvivens]KOS07824.1 hypothetical protein AM493_18515 [Flavobacterium akiainvivens]SFQ27078.1 hypothetical protein SAMN05444144_102285 [Flavobacterium akiainvivens]